MSRIRTARLCLMPCSLDVALSVVNDHSVIRTMPGISLPDDWPAKDLMGILPWYVKQLRSDPEMYGWGIWLMIDSSSKQVIGDIGFKGRPENGAVEIGYSVIPRRRRQGYASEAASAIVEWAFGHKEVDTIKGECEKDNIPSIRILEKLGMTRREDDGDLLRWSMRKATDKQ